MPIFEHLPTPVDIGEGLPYYYYKGKSAYRLTSPVPPRTNAAALGFISTKMNVCFVFKLDTVLAFFEE